MRLTNVKDVQKFIDAVNDCNYNVYLKSPEGDVFNLKSSLSQYVAIGRLVQESGDLLELFADNREDEYRLLEYLREKENEKD